MAFICMKYTNNLRSNKKRSLIQNWKLEKWPKAIELVRIRNWSYMLLLKNFQITYSLVQNTHRVVILKHTGKNHLCLCQQNHKTAIYFYPGGGSSFTSHPNVNISLILLEPISPICKGNNGNLDSTNRLLWKIKWEHSWDRKI